MGDLRLENLTIDYGARAVIQGIDLDVHDGEMVSLLGPSGAGKTTILKHMARSIIENHPDAAVFVLLAVFYPLIAHHLGFEEGTPGQRFFSLVIGLALFALLLVYRSARSSIAGG